MTYSFVGFNEQTLTIRESIQNVILEESMLALHEVFSIVDDEMEIDDALKGRVSGINSKKSNVMIRGTSSLAIPTVKVENQTTVDFIIDTPWSIKSDNQNYVVDMQVYDLPVYYQYYCVPKADPSAFLLANVVDWEQYSLLEGEANVFFEETYIGKTLLDVKYAKDTLEISLGRDKQVSVTRKKIKDYTSKRFIGKNKEESRAWRTTVKNNKNKEINMLILDQVPVSTVDEIIVETHSVSGAKKDKITGELQWEFSLPAGSEKELDLRYSVKYPKHRTLIVE